MGSGGKKVTVGSIYLIAYNLACAAGWTYCLYLCLTAYNEGKSAAELYVDLKDPLTYVQTAALMEIVHSLVKLVRSPVVTVILQVSSRILLVWGYTRPFVECQRDWSLYLMVISWSCAEIPRYIFYIFAQFQEQHEMPAFLVFLRYHLFYVLYPTGISGECLQMYAFWRDARAQSQTMEYATYLVAVVYVFGSPGMIMNMNGNRKKAYKNIKEELAKKGQ